MFREHTNQIKYAYCTCCLYSGIHVRYRSENMSWNLSLDLSVRPLAADDTYGANICMYCSRFGLFDRFENEIVFYL